jgi:hypothetical protein
MSDPNLYSELNEKEKPDIKEDGISSDEEVSFTALLAEGEYQ